MSRYESTFDYKALAQSMVTMSKPFDLSIFTVHYEIATTIDLYTTLADDPGYELEVFDDVKSFAMCVGDNCESVHDYEAIEQIIASNYLEEFIKLNDLIKEKQRQKEMF